jgi:hypothetical protein
VRNKSQFLVQILLPITGTSDGTEAFAQTRAELVAEFQGVTAYERAPAQGLWVAPNGGIQNDQMLMVEVLTPRLDHGWWRAYKERLAHRFAQQEMHVRVLRVDVL